MCRQAPREACFDAARNWVFGCSRQQRRRRRLLPSPPAFRPRQHTCLHVLTPCPCPSCRRWSPGSSPGRSNQPGGSCGSASSLNQGARGSAKPVAWPATAAASCRRRPLDTLLACAASPIPLPMLLLQPRKAPPSFSPVILQAGAHRGLSSYQRPDCIPGPSAHVPAPPRHEPLTAGSGCSPPAGRALHGDAVGWACSLCLPPD